MICEFTEFDELDGEPVICFCGEKWTDSYLAKCGEPASNVVQFGCVPCEEGKPCQGKHKFWLCDRHHKAYQD